MGKLPENFSNAGRLKFLPEALVVGGTSMSEGRSIEQQIADEPRRALSELRFDWGTYKTSFHDQAVFTAQALDRIEARQIAQNVVIEQIAKAVTGETINVDYDEIERRIAKNMPVYVPQAVEGDNE